MTCFIRLVKDGGNVSLEALILKTRIDNLSLKRLSSIKICKRLKYGVADSYLLAKNMIRMHLICLVFKVDNLVLAADPQLMSP